MRWLLFAAALIPAPVAAQGVITPDAASLQVQISAALAKANAAVTSDQLSAVQAQIPIPAGSAPPMDTAAGSAGTAGTYATANSVRMRQSRTGSCQLAASATSCTGTWDGAAFPSGSTVQNVGDPGVINTAGGSPYICNYVTVTASGFSATCQRAQASLLTISALTSAATTGVTLSPFATPTSVVTVTATAITKSQ